MNESISVNAFASNNYCRICLRTTNDLSPMSNEYKNWYRSIVDDVPISDHNMKTCTICLWMLKRYQKFRHQCISANNFLKELVHTDSKALIFLKPLNSIYQMTQTKTETNDYTPSTFPNNLIHYNQFENCTNSYDNKLEIDRNEYSKLSDNTNDCHMTISEIGTYNIERILEGDNKCDNVQRGATDTFDNDMYQNDVIDNDMYQNDVIDNDMHQNDVIDNEDELPLVLLRESVENEKKRRKKKKKIKYMKTNMTTAEESIVEQNKNSDDKLKPKKMKKELRDGFTSRMVQETDEYVVIKLTRDQVLEEMSDRAKTDEFLRSPFKCERCIKAFNFEDVLQTHMEKHSMKNGTFECDMCGQYCPSAVSLRGHIKSHTTRYKCKLCGQVRLSRQHLLEHHAITHTSAATSYSCDYCQFTTNKRTVMQRHVRRHAAREPLACHKCGKLFKSIESLRLHTVRHEPARFPCPRCARTFVQRSLLRRHVACVHDRREYYCVECDVQFNCAESLRLHFKRAKKHRDSSAYVHACEECEARFVTPPALAAHRGAAHGAPRAHACPHCRRLYSTRDAVRAHAWRVHGRGDARVACPDCGASFARKSTLKVHILTHTDARPHACACGAAFAQAKTLQAHMQAKHKKEDTQQYEKN